MAATETSMVERRSMTKAAILALIERLEKAEGPDREIDGLLAELSGSPSWAWFARANTLDKLSLREGNTKPIEVWIYFSKEGGGWWQWGPRGWRRDLKSEELARNIAASSPGPWFSKPEPHEVEIVREASEACSHYTASLDSALALVERVLPNLSPLIGVDRNYGFDNDIPGSEETPRWNAWCYGQGGEHPTSPAIALLIAALSALKSLAQEEGTK